MALGDDDPDARSIRTIQNVPRSKASDWGQSILLDVEFFDGQTVQLMIAKYLVLGTTAPFL
jgi:hypothetical protein